MPELGSPRGIAVEGPGHREYFEPVCGLPNEVWVRILSYLKGPAGLQLMQVSKMHRDIVWREFKLGEPLDGKPSKLLVQAAQTNDIALVCRCMRASLSAPETWSEVGLSGVVHAVRDLEGRGEDASGARLALGGLIRMSPELFYSGKFSSLHLNLARHEWDPAHLLLQCGVSVNQKNCRKGGWAPIVTCLGCAKYGQPPPSELLDTLLGEGLDLDSLTHWLGSPVWLIVDFVAKVPDYVVPGPFKARFATFFKDNPEKLHAAPADWDLEVSCLINTTPLHCLIEYRSAEWVRWLLEVGADPNVRDGSGRTPLAYLEGREDWGARDRAIADALIAKGAHSNTQDEDGSEGPSVSNSESSRGAYQSSSLSSDANSRTPSGSSSKEVKTDQRPRAQQSDLVLRVLVASVLLLALIVGLRALLRPVRPIFQVRS